MFIFSRIPFFGTAVVVLKPWLIGRVGLVRAHCDCRRSCCLSASILVLLFLALLHGRLPRLLLAPQLPSPAMVCWHGQTGNVLERSATSAGEGPTSPATALVQKELPAHFHSLNPCALRRERLPTAHVLGIDTCHSQSHVLHITVIFQNQLSRCLEIL